MLGAKDAAAVHGDDKDKGPAKQAPLCGFRVLLSTLGNTEGGVSPWYKLAAVRSSRLVLRLQPLRTLLSLMMQLAAPRCSQPEDIVESGAVLAGENDETSHGIVLIEAKQNWSKKSMRSRLFGVLNG